MPKKISIALILSFLILLMSYSLTFAIEGGYDSFYDSTGFNSNRTTESVVDFEHIDPFTGGLILNFVDVRLPGNGGLDLVVQRTYNSKNACLYWLDTNGFVTCPGGAVDSWVGAGWSMHMGKLYASEGLNPLIVMPDGSLHVAHKTSTLNQYITKEYWKLYYNPLDLPPVLTFTDGKKITFAENYQFDSTYYATKIEDANGNAITITYYNSTDPVKREKLKGAINTITDSVGRQTMFYLTPSPIPSSYGKYRLNHINLPDGNRVTFSYQTITGNSTQALLQYVTPPEGNSWEFKYQTGIYELTELKTPFGGKINYTYKTNGYTYYVGGVQCAQYYRTVSQKTTSGRDSYDFPAGTWDISYFQNPNNEYTVITDSCGRTTKYRHYGYNSGLLNGDMWKLGLPISKETVGEEIITYNWTKSASPISYDDYIGPICGYSYVIDYGIYIPYLSSRSITRDGKTYITNYSNYDAYGNPQTISESGDKARTITRTYWYNTTKNIVQNKPLSESVSGSFSGTFTTNYSYDSNGNQIRLNKYGVITDYSYYSNGNLYYMTDANGNTTYYTWTNGRISKITNPIYSISRIINTNGTVASETNGRGYTTYFEYDRNLRLTKITPPAGNPTTFTYPSDNSYKLEQRGGFYTYYYYDGLGRPSGSSNSKGIITETAYKSCGPQDYTTSNIGDTVYYDNFGRVTNIVHQDNTNISYQYLGSNVIVTDEAGGKTYFTYNAFGNPDEKYLASVKDPLNNTTSYTINMLGSITKITQGTLTRTYNYNTKNFLKSETHPETGTITYTRDNVGNMTSKTDALGKKSYTYDKLHRLTKITYNIETVNFTYDKADNRIAMTSPSASITYVYDSANRLTQKTETIAGVIYTTQYTYDGNDNITTIAYPTGLLVNYTYNSNNQVTSVTGFGGGIYDITYHTTGSSIGLPKSFTYSNRITTTLAYNNRNLTTNITAAMTAAIPVLKLGYNYDSRGNTTSITDYLDSTKNQSFTYDGLGRLTGFNGSWGTGSYTYDSSGNRLSKTVAGIATSYTYSSNRLISTTGGEPAAFSYNGYGSLTGLTLHGNSYTLEYDLLYNLKSYKSGTTTLADFTYDGDGQRITKTSNGNTVVYHYGIDGNVLSETDSAGNTISDYVYLNGKLAAKITLIPTPEISVSPPSHGFGSVNVGTSQVKSFLVTNIGTAELIPWAITLTGVDASEFSKTFDNCTGQPLIPNATCTIQVTFTPVSTGSKNANLSISSNAPDTPTFNVPLSGTGVIQYTLSVTKTGTGSGIVTTSPAGINCGVSCSAPFDSGAPVVLTATPNTGSTFTGWSGDADCADGQVTMDATKTCTANFTINTYIVTPSAGVNGSISPNTPQMVNYNETTSFTVIPDAGYQIGSVSGCGGTLSGNIYTTGPITNDCTVIATFIVITPTITVTSPNGGEVWLAGTTQTITWTYVGNPGAYVKIESLRNGGNANTIITSTPIGSNGTGSYTWTIPSNQIASTTYQIRITSTSNNTVKDISDNYFTINAPTITVTSPNGGEVWTRGSTHTISWTYTGGPGPVKIELLYNGGNANTIVSSTSEGSNGSGSYEWTIPYTQTPRTSYQIRVKSTSNNNVYDLSDSYFTIQ